MGAWGAGLYANDYSADLRSAIAAVTRLPFDAKRLTEILCEMEPDAANSPEDSDHTTFWLVLADQFAKKNLACNRVRDTALAIIDSGRDIANLESLGMNSSDLKKRRNILAELRGKLLAPPSPSKPRKTLQRPQPWIMAVGDLLVYPTCRGDVINPYFTEKMLSDTDWQADGWGAMVIIETGRAFEFLAWYRFLTIAKPIPQKPTVSCLLSEVEWFLRPPGTCSAAHFKRMQLEKVHQLNVDASRLRRHFPKLSPGLSCAVNDISIANQLHVGPTPTRSFNAQKQADGSHAQVDNLAAITSEE